MLSPHKLVRYNSLLVGVALSVLLLLISSSSGNESHISERIIKLEEIPGFEVTIAPDADVALIAACKQVVEDANHLAKQIKTKKED